MRGSLTGKNTSRLISPSLTPVHEREDLAGITRLHRYYGPLRHPNAPGLSLTGVRLTISDHAFGRPGFCGLSPSLGRFRAWLRHRSHPLDEPDEVILRGPYT